MNKLFYDPEFSDNVAAAMDDWANTHNQVMHPVLCKTLLEYCSAQTVMQILESIHRLVNIKQGQARKSTPASLSAFLRRRANGDLRQPQFREHMTRHSYSIRFIFCCRLGL